MITTDMSPFQRIYAIVSKIPAGKVMTYKQISILANVATPRIVGFAMAGNKTPDTVPCHRVVKHDGTLAGYGFGGAAEKKKKLLAEYVPFLDETHIDLGKAIYTKV